MVCKVNIVTTNLFHYFSLTLKKIQKVAFERFRDFKNDKCQPCRLKLCNESFPALEFSGILKATTIKDGGVTNHCPTK